MFLNRKFTILFWMLVFAVGLFSCQPKAIKNLAQIQLPVDVHFEPMISMSFGEELTYRAKVNGFQQEISGLLVVKKLEDEYRFVMITDFGLKVFDLSLKLNTEYEFHHIMKHMDYEFLKNSIALNMLMLLPVELDVESKFYQKDDFVIYIPQKKILYFVRDEQVKQVQRFRGKRKVWAEASMSGKTIEIHQYKPQIFIQLKPL